MFGSSLATPPYICIIVCTKIWKKCACPKEGAAEWMRGLTHRMRKSRFSSSFEPLAVTHVRTGFGTYVFCGEHWQK
jgi:hypothetical protein